MSYDHGRKEGAGEKRGQRGATLLYVIAGIVILATVGAGVAKLSPVSTQSVRGGAVGDAAYYAALSGQNYVRTVFDDNSTDMDAFEDAINATPQLTLDGGAVITIAMGTASGSVLPVSVKGVVNSGTSQEAAFIIRQNYTFGTGGGGDTDKNNSQIIGGSADGTFTLPSGSNVVGNVAGENISLSAGANVTGNISAAGNVTLDSDASVDGDICSEGNVILYNQTEIGSINCLGDVTVGSSRTVIHGDIVASGNVTIQQGATIQGSISAGGYVLFQSSDSVVNGNIYTGGNTRLEGAYCTAAANVYSQSDITMPGWETEISGAASAMGKINASNSSARIYGLASARGTILPNDMTRFPGGTDPHDASLVVPEPTEPISCAFPATPTLTTCTATGSINTGWSGSTTITSGAHCYSSIKTGSSSTVNIDLSGGDVAIIVNGNVNFGWSTTFRITDGTDTVTVNIGDDIVVEGSTKFELLKKFAKSIYLESHGTVSFGDSARWVGGILATGNINLSYQFQLIGFVRSINGTIATGSISKMYYVPSNYANSNW